jgi:hypothetical protein
VRLVIMPVALGPDDSKFQGWEIVPVVRITPLENVAPGCPQSNDVDPRGIWGTGFSSTN